MNARLRIVIEARAKRAAVEVAKVDAAIKSAGASARKFNLSNMTAGLGRMRTGLSKVGAALSRTFGKAAAANLVKFGKNLQWTGRQLEFRITLPLLLAAGAATKFALANETALTRLRKVYGTVKTPIAQVTEEVDALREAMRALSDVFGVQQSEVTRIGAVWAQAGASGAGLAEATRLTLETMILGSMEADATVKALITTMQAYSFSVEEMTGAIAVLNVVENESAASLTGLVKVISIAGATARTSGVSIRELAAMTAALVPAFGTAQEVGTALRSIIFRMMAPTVQATEAFKRLGIATEEAGWQNATFTERLHQLAGSYEGLDQVQRLAAARDIAQLRQGGRLVGLLDDLISENSKYANALNATADAEANVARMNRELGIVLSSQPQAMKIVSTQLQNLMAEAIMPLLPAIIAVFREVVNGVRWFTELSPRVQEVVLAVALFLGILGPLVAILGTLFILIGIILKPLFFFGNALLFTAKSMGWLILKTKLLILWTRRQTVATLMARLATLGWVAVVLIVLTALAMLAYMYRNEIPGALAAMWDVTKTVYTAMVSATIATVKGIITAIYAVPEAFAIAMNAVVEVVSKAAMAVYEWLQWMNPFATHSPSLVSQVKDGVAIIAAEYASLGKVGNVFRRAAQDFRTFLSATERARAALRMDKIGESRIAVEKFDPSLLPSFDMATAELQKLQNALALVGVQMSNQQSIVDLWGQALEDAERKLAPFAAELERLEGVADAVSNALRDAKSDLRALLDTPLTGMKDANAEIFANTQAQKLLRLELLRLGDTGSTIDDIAGRISGLQSEIDSLTGERTNLRNAGAGSDILGFYDAQITALESAKSSLGSGGGGGGGVINGMEQQLALLETQGQILRLEFETVFDPMKEALDAVADTTEELSFDQLFADISAQVALVTDLEQQQLSANLAVEAQQAIVAQLSAERDLILTKYDMELDKLSQIKDTYSGIKDEIDEINNAIDFWATVTSTPGSGGGGADELSGDFEVPGGTGGLLPTNGGVNEINALTEEWLAEAEKGFDTIKLQDELKKLTDSLSTSFPVESLENIAGVFDDLKDKMASFGDFLDNKVKPVIDAIGRSFWIWGPILAYLLGGIFVFLIAALAVIAIKWGPLIIDTIVKWSKAVAGFFVDMAKAVAAAAVAVWNWTVNMAKLIGSAIAGFVMSYIVKPLVWVAKWIAKWASKIGKAVWEFLVPIFKEVWGIITEGGAFFVALWNIIKPILDILVTTFVFWGNVAWSAIQKIGEAFSNLWRLIQPLLHIIGGLLLVAFDALKRVALTVWEGWGDAIGVAMGLLGGVWDIIQGGIDFIITVFWVLWDVVKDVFESIRDIIAGALRIIKGVIQVATGIISGDWGKMWDGMKSILSGAWSVIKGLVDIGWALFKGAFKIGIAAITLLWKTAWTVLKNLLSVGWGLIKIAFDTAWTLLKSVMVTAKNWIVDIFGAIWGTVKTKFSESLSDLGSKFFGYWMTLRGYMKTAKDWVRDTFVGAFETAKEKIVGAFTGIKDGIKTAMSGLEGILRNQLRGAIRIMNFLIGGFNTVTGVVGIPAIPEIPQISGQSGPPRHAKGAIMGASEVGSGFITDGARAIVGEGSSIHDEYVIPTDPRYRSRARDLYASLGNDLYAAGGVVNGGNTTVPKLGIGGFIGDTFSGIGDLGLDLLGGIVSGIVKGLLALPKKLFDIAVGQMPDSPKTAEIGKGIVKSGGQGMYDGIIDLASFSHGGMLPITRAANGAVVKARAGGHLMRVGEGGQDEAIVPLPNGLRADGGSSGGDTYITFHDTTFEFPDLDNPDDAQKFVDSLEVMASST